MVMGLVFRWSLANHSNSESFLVAHASLSQDGCQREGFWEVDGHVVSPLDLSRTLLVGGGLLVPFRISCHKTTHANGYYGSWPGWAVPVSVLLDKSPVLGPGGGPLSCNREIFKSMCTNKSKGIDFHHLIVSF